MKKLLFLLMAAGFATASCGYIGGKKVRGNGNVVSQDHTVSAFKNVQVSGSVDLFVSQGELKPVKIETDDNLQQYIEVKQQGDKVIIKFKSGFNPEPTNKIKAFVTTPQYSNIDVSGASNITGETKITSNEGLGLQVSGAGDINMDVSAPDIQAKVSGAGEVNLKGQTKTLDLNLTGAGNAHCYELQAEATKVDISGAGDADVFASVKLEAQVTGAGTVTYKGGATSISQHVSGAGSVKKAD